jgi:hypothetical protein
MPDVTVLITALGSTTALSVIKDFRQQHTFRVWIIGTDIHPQQPRSLVNSAFPAIVSTNGRKKSPGMVERSPVPVGKPTRLPN